METKANYVAVGAFVLASVLGFVVALLWLAGAQYSAEYAYYRTYFSGAVTGLGDGTIVRYNGINVGHVSKLTFDPNDPKRVIVDLQVDPTLKIHNDSIASIASEGLTGGSYVEIDGGSATAPVLERRMFGDYPIIKSKQSTLQQLEQSAPELIAKLSHVADRLNKALSDENIKNFSGILSNIKTTTDVFKARSADIDKTLHNVSLASDTLNVDLKDLHTTLGNANVAVTKVSRLADDADSAVNGANLDQLSDQVRTLARSLTKLSNGLEREPTKLLFGDRRKGYTPNEHALRISRRAALVVFSAAALSACGSLLGPSEAPPQIYVLHPQFGPVDNAPATSWQIGIPQPITSDVLDSKRISLVRGQTMDYYANAAWTDQTGDLLQDLLVEAFEKSGKVKAVGPTSGGVRADLLVVTEVRDFTAHYAGADGAPNVVVDIVVKLITSTHHDVVATHDARAEVPASANSVPAVVQAFNQATGQAINEVVSWSLVNATPQASDALPPTTAAPAHRRRRHH